MQKIIECVPNFSEGRDVSKVEAIIAAMRDVPGIAILDRESDADHNRSVVTLAGEPDAVAEAALRGVGKAKELIDLTQHSGAHPRIGATDVVPFIPVQGVELEDCVALARRVGHEIRDRFQIPVYFYEAAADRPERANLENIRKGQFEGLREEVQTQLTARAGHRRAATALHGRRYGCWRAKVPDRVQRQSEYAGHQNRQQDCQGDPLFDGRLALRKVHGRGASLARAGAGLYQPDGFRIDSDAPRFRNGAA